MPTIKHITPYFEESDDKTLLSGFKIELEYYNYEIIIRNDSNEKMRSDGVLTT